jgi:hypothetical protein
LLTGYVGAKYETHDNDDHAAKVRGTEVGVRALLEYYTQLNPNIDFYASGSYSSAFGNWYAFSRLGFKVVPQRWTGPEFSYFRSDDSDYRETRLGWFVRFDEIFPGYSLSVSAGVINEISVVDNKQSNLPWYAGASLYFTFR